MHLKHDFTLCWNLDTMVSWSEVPGKFWNAVLVKNGEDQMDRSCEKWSTTWRQGRKDYPKTIKKRKAAWIGHIFRKNCILKHIIEGKPEGRIEVTGGRERICKQLLDDLKYNIGYWKLKEAALDRTLWGTRFGRGYGRTEFIFPTCTVFKIHYNGLHLSKLSYQYYVSWINHETPSASTTLWRHIEEKRYRSTTFLPQH
jgi:hypothetical protein